MELVQSMEKLKRRRRCPHSLRHLRGDTSGMSMVSLVCAFCILLLGLAMITSSVFVAINLTRRAEEQRLAADSIVSGYNDGTIQLETEIPVTMTFAAKNGQSGGFSVSCTIIPISRDADGNTLVRPLYFFGTAEMESGEEAAP